MLFTIGTISMPLIFFRAVATSKTSDNTIIWHIRIIIKSGEVFVYQFKRMRCVKTTRGICHMHDCFFFLNSTNAIYLCPSFNFVASSIHHIFLDGTCPFHCLHIYFIYKLMHRFFWLHAVFFPYNKYSPSVCRHFLHLCIATVNYVKRILAQIHSHIYYVSNRSGEYAVMTNWNEKFLIYFDNILDSWHQT